MFQPSPNDVRRFFCETFQRVRDDGGPLDVTCGYERYRRTGNA